VGIAKRVRRRVGRKSDIVDVNIVWEGARW
jgi:hypothetical protein